MIFSRQEAHFQNHKYVFLQLISAFSEQDLDDTLCLQSILLNDIIVQIVVHLLFISVHNNQILVHISMFFGTREHFLVHFLVHGR